ISVFFTSNTLGTVVSENTVSFPSIILISDVKKTERAITDNEMIKISALILYLILKLESFIDSLIMGV
ncbi:hypothetical protein CGJ38_15000, partial [Vibrio parahaemolyticus]